MRCGNATVVASFACRTDLGASESPCAGPVAPSKPVKGSGFRVQGSGFRVQGFRGSGVQGFRVGAAAFRV